MLKYKPSKPFSPQLAFGLPMILLAIRVVMGYRSGELYSPVSFQLPTPTAPAPGAAIMACQALLSSLGTEFSLNWWSSSS